MVSRGNEVRDWSPDPFGKTINTFKDQTLNFFKHRITNAIVEGTNNKIKTLKRQAYGCRDMGYFKLRLYHLHSTGYSFAG